MNDFTPEPRRASGVELVAGAQLGKYRLERKLGAGGMGDVWDAHDVDLDRRVALKFMGGEFAGDGIARGRLVREARAMARLRHANVITVYDAETLDGRDVIVMELVEGETLGTWLERDHTKHEIVAKLLDAGRGLAAAHAAGIVHRDFKPHNVLLDRGGRVVVTDFGLARAVGELPAEPSAPSHPPSDRDVAATIPDRPRASTSNSGKAFGALDSPLTITGTVLGTPAYMAPEQMSGSPADERADQFAFCTTFWEALSGRRPFAGDSVPEIAEAIGRRTPRDIGRIPRRLRSVLMRGLAVEPAARWPSIEALLGRIERAWRRPRRLAFAGTALAVAGIAAVIGYRAFSSHGTWAPKIVDLPAYEENSDSVAISPDGKWIAYTSDRERTDWYRVYIAKLDGGETRAITPAGDSFEGVRWSRDGKAIIAARWSDAGYHIMRVPLDGSAPTDYGRGHEADDCGDAIAIADFDPSAGWVSLQHLDTGKREELLRSNAEFIMAPRCDPSGQHIAVTRSLLVTSDKSSGDLVVVDRAGHETKLTKGHTATNGSFARDGRTIVFSQQAADDSVLLYEVPVTGGTPRRVTFDNGPHLSASVSGDGTTLVFDRDERTRVPVVGGDGEIRKLVARRAVFDSVDLMDDGRLLTSRLDIRSDTLYIVVVDPRDGSEHVLGPGARPSLSFDHKRVLFTPPKGHPALLSMSVNGGAVETLADLTAEMVSAVDGPDGQHMVLHHADGKMEMVHLTLDRKLEPESAPGLPMHAPSGGWWLYVEKDGYHFVKPDGTASDLVIKGEARHPTWLDDHRLAYPAKGKFHVVDVTTGAELSSMPGPSWGIEAQMTADGTRWYDIESLGHVTRHMIVNFGDR